MAHLTHVLAISLLLAAPVAAQTRRALTEGLAASGNTVFTDTTTVRVGVGTSSPGTTLDVQGSAQFGANVLKSTFNATPGATTYAVNLASGVKLANGCVSYSDGTLQCTASSGGGGGGGSGVGWSRDNSGFIYVTTATDNVLIQSTLTVQGAKFSVGGSSLTMHDGIFNVKSQPGVALSMSTGAIVLNITTHTISTWDVVIASNASSVPLYDPTKTDRITIPTGGTGWWTCEASVKLKGDDSTAGNFVIGLATNGRATCAQCPERFEALGDANFGHPAHGVGKKLFLYPGDFVRVYVRADSGGTHNIVPGNGSVGTYFSCVKE